MQYAEVAKTIDHALLTPTLSDRGFDAGVEVARRYEVASVCVLPCLVRRAAERLRGSSVRTSTVIGFPHGVVPTSVKRFEAERALEAGAVELDMVVNSSWVQSEQLRAVQDDIGSVLAACRQADAKLKVIFENCYLNEAQKLALCRVCAELEVDWIKTSTGFGSGGATLGDVQLMRANSPARVAVKASGGIRDLDTLLGFLPYVTRVGTSNTRGILDELRQRLGLPALLGEDTVVGSY